MMGAPASQPTPAAKPAPDQQSDILSFFIGGQMFGLPLLLVQDVLNARAITKIPLAPADIAGALNLRGRIITAIDMRRRLRLPAAGDGCRHMSVVVCHDGELYSLVVDQVGDVLSLGADRFEDNPTNLDPQWRELASGVYRLDTQLMLVLDAAAVLAIGG